MAWLTFCILNVSLAPNCASWFLNHCASDLGHTVPGIEFMFLKCLDTLTITVPNTYFFN